MIGASSLSKPASQIPVRFSRAERGMAPPLPHLRNAQVLLVAHGDFTSPTCEE
jgi:hypothetical protein